MTDVQRALAAHEQANPLAAVRVRAGVHLADAVVGRDRQRFDLAVITAAKVMDRRDVFMLQAAGGNITIGVGGTREFVRQARVGRPIVREIASFSSHSAA